MTVQDNRGVQHLPAFMREILYPGVRADVTQADKDAWIARLESADSNKAVGVLHDEESNAACALGHLNDVAPELAFIPHELYKKIVELNDIDNLTLPEIAVWVKENVEVTA